MLQLVWAHKELRRPLEKDGWKKTDFMVNLNPNTTTTNGPSTRANGTYEDSTTPLLDRGTDILSASEPEYGRFFKLKSVNSNVLLYIFMVISHVCLFLGDKRDLIPLNDLGPGEYINLLCFCESLYECADLICILSFLRFLLYTGPEGEETHSGRNHRHFTGTLKPPFPA